MADNMVERVARVLARKGAESLGVPGINLYVEENWSAYEVGARAAIEVMWVPTDAMVKAAGWDASYPDICWQAMIDEALAP